MNPNNPTNRPNLHVTVAAICEENGRFLMVEEIPKGSSCSVLNQPAGHVELGESFTEAIIRETLEETGYKFTPEALVGIYPYQVNNALGYMRCCISGKISSMPLLDSANLDPEIIAVHWLSAERILHNRALRSPLVKHCLEDYLNGQRHSLAILQPLIKAQISDF